MPVELAWVERQGESFAVKRGTYRIGETYAARTETGSIVLVISGAAGERISDAGVLIAVASAITAAPGVVQRPN